MGTPFGGEAIRAVRTMQNLSRRALATRARVAEDRLKAIEAGAPPTPDELRGIWTVLVPTERHAGVEEGASA